MPRIISVLQQVVVVVVVALVAVSSGNLCALCQSLSQLLPSEFHSCMLRNSEIRHCDESTEPHVAALKVVGVKRVVKVNYGDDGSSSVYFDFGVEVVTDYDAIQGSGDQADQATQHNSNQQHHALSHHGAHSPSNISNSAAATNPRHGTPSLTPHHVQLAVVRFSRYPSSLLMQNPCRHVLGTSNGPFGKRRNIPGNGQRISTLYFAIDDKACRSGGGGRGRRKKCMRSPSNSTHPYTCCSPLRPDHPHVSPPTCPRNDTPPWQHGSGHQPPDDHSSGAAPQSELGSNTPILRPLVLSIQIVCISFTVILLLIIFWIRKSKVIQVSVWPLTESIVFGSLLLYVTVAIRASYDFDSVSEAPWWSAYSMEPHQQAWACVVEPWARELGFTLVYGGIVLKIYRSLVEFRTRKAHRWVVREKDILRYLGTTLGVVLFYLLAWTCTIQVDGGGEELWHAEDVRNEIVCPAVSPWHRVTEIGELLYIAVGLNMAWHLRTSPVSPFLERQMYTAALVVEATTSVLLIVIRESKLMFFTAHAHLNHNVHGVVDSSPAQPHIPEYDSEEEENATFLLLAYFIRCHVTTTVVLALVLGPKLYYVYLDASTRKRAQLRRGDTLSGTGGGGGGGTGGGGGSTTGPASAASLSNLTNLKLSAAGGMIGGVDHHTLIDLDFAEVSLAEMDPQDIKMELKRVYTQLELLRNKTMRKDNPHISKRRGGRKPTHRRFSLQKKGSRDKTAAAAAAMRSRMQAQQAQMSQQDSYTNNRYSSSRYNDDIEDSVCSIEGPSTYSEVGGYR